MVSMSVEDARRAGVNYVAGQRGYSQTANGVAATYKVKLGMSFLGRLEMRREGDSMTLAKRY